MSVLIEALSVVVLRASVDARYPGGVAAFERDCPNATYCADEHLARVGFMTPADVEHFVRGMVRTGLVHVRDGQAVDIVVVDQLQGPTTQCDWIEGGRHPDGYSAAWLAGTMPGGLATPRGWTAVQSTQMKFVPSADVDRRMLGLTKDGDIDVVLDLETGREGFIGRVPPWANSDEGG